MPINAKEILKEKSSLSKELDKKPKILLPLLIFFIIDCFLSFFLVFDCLDKNNYVSLNYLGFSLQIDNPFLIAILYISISSLIFGILIFVYFTFSISLATKIETLENTHRTMLLTEQILTVLSDDEEATNINSGVQGMENSASAHIKSAAIQKDDGDKLRLVPVKIKKDGSGKIICPVCGTKQNDNRFCCFHCATPFVNKQPGIPYWCSTCGLPGPFEGNCPKCNGSNKITND